MTDTAHNGITASTLREAPGMARSAGQNAQQVERIAPELSPNKGTDGEERRGMQDLSDGRSKETAATEKAPSPRRDIHGGLNSAQDTQHSLYQAHAEQQGNGKLRIEKRQLDNKGIGQKDQGEQHTKKQSNQNQANQNQDIKKHDIKNQDIKTHDIKKHDIKNEDIKTHDIKKHDIKNQDIKTHDTKKHDSKNEDTKTHEIKKQDDQEQDIKNSGIGE
ncbi:hypothetical protein ISF_08946 [Cordyceps fumosorosea ARSEF 2679]|uniref:Uncharacterized protein n=1 Tax=Cordyceps fumosorosea (strain ARSEF 2679) TaxID=1081104 RepID=A0A167LL53_CORFA|nr:hypothetical protein ISF_08946 [Cordyceps fumosorosea ARSEF 2679]OAA53214.1 hypothetical protein ISF_08946 [Cordyceps fumosorosea ARSEF 2679]